MVDSTNTRGHGSVASKQAQSIPPFTTVSCCNLFVLTKLSLVFTKHRVIHYGQTTPIWSYLFKECNFKKHGLFQIKKLCCHVFLMKRGFLLLVLRNKPYFILFQMVLNLNI